MKNAILVIGLFLAVLSASSVRASEEEQLPIAEVRIVAAERKETGRVAFHAKVDGDEYKEVRIEAFGKEYPLEKRDLALLSGFPLTSLEITHETGYEKLGGHTVYFKFKRPVKDPTATSKGTIIVSKGKGLTFSGFINVPPAGGR